MSLLRNAAILQNKDATDPKITIYFQTAEDSNRFLDWCQQNMPGSDRSDQPHGIVLQ